MITNPQDYIETFAKAGADIIIVHQEVCPHLHRVIQQIRNAGKIPAVALNPSTPVFLLEDVLSLKPDIVFLPDEPFAFTRTDADAIMTPHPALRATLSRRERACDRESSLPLGEGAAKRRVRVIGPFPGHLFTWHGVRTIEGLRFLRREL